MDFYPTINQEPPLPSNLTVKGKKAKSNSNKKMDRLSENFLSLDKFGESFKMNLNSDG